MGLALAGEPRIVHVLPGRVRFHLPALSSWQARAAERYLRAVPGVYSAQANALTCNVLVRFDPAITSAGTLLKDLCAAAPEQSVGMDDGRTRAGDVMARGAPLAPRVIYNRHGQTARARISVPGLDRNPEVAHRIVAYLDRWPGIRARANLLTGRVLVEFNIHDEHIEDILSELAHVELPDIPEEDQPTHPLDRAPLVQSASRTAGAALGLSLLGVRRLTGLREPLPGSGAAAYAASIIGLIQGFPATRNRVRALLGRDLADLLFSGAAIVSLALAGSPLGLAVTGAEALRLLTEVIARRKAWCRYEEGLVDAHAAHPDAVIRLKAGERCPLSGEVIEGTGTAIGRDGLPVPVGPGDRISAGACLHGGPCVVQLEGCEPFEPQPRPAPLAPTLYDRYQQALGPISLAYALAVVVLTRSPARLLEALLLVNPRTAIIGSESATLGASARALRAGVVVVGTRPERYIRRPDTVLVDGSRVLADGLELAGVVSLDDAYDAGEMIDVAVGVAAAAGSPWNGAFRASGHAEASDGSFDGRRAAATVSGVRYTLGPVGDDVSNIALGLRLRHRGSCLLALRHGGTHRPLALFALQPRLAPTVSELVRTCRQYRIELGLVSHGDPAAAQDIARRTGIPLVEQDDPVAAIRAYQERGAFVALVSDSAHAAAAFAACDLAIGLSSGHSGEFPARADLLASDLAHAAAIVEAGVYRQAAVRDAVGLSILANIAGAIWGFRGRPGVERASMAVYVTALTSLVDGWLRLRGGERSMPALPSA